MKKIWKPTDFQNLLRPSSGNTVLRKSFFYCLYFRNINNYIIISYVHFHMYILLLLLLLFLFIFKYSRNDCNNPTTLHIC